MDITTRYLGMTLRSPLVASASPLSEDIGRIRQIEDAGASAVVLYSLFEEQITHEQPDLNYAADVPAPGVEPYLKQIEKAKAAVEIPVIASLNGKSTGGWTAFANQIERAGADALELNIYSIPTDPTLSSAAIEESYVEIVQAVKAAVKIPVAVKLSPYFTNMAYVARLIDEAGADALVLFNRFYQPDIDIETMMAEPNVKLSTSQELRVPLRWIAILRSQVKADLAATSGIHTPEDVLKMVMVGARVTMMASALMQHGIEHIGTVEAGLIRWLIDHDYESLHQLSGSMSWQQSGNPGAFERVQYMKAVSSLPDDKSS